MKTLLLMLVTATLLLPTPALACNRCPLHGEMREQQAWGKILAPQAPKKTAVAIAKPATKVRKAAPKVASKG